MSKVKNELPCPTESAEQIALFRWAELQRKNMPGLELIYHIPNGGSRNKAEAANLKMQGVKAGVPDICLPVARGHWHGMYIEMKRRKGARVSSKQREYIEALRKQGYLAVVCKGWCEAAMHIEGYMRYDERLKKMYDGLLRLPGDEELYIHEGDDA